MLLGGACPPLGAAYADAVFDAHSAAGRASWVGEKAKLAGAGVGMSRDIADLGLGGGCWVWLSTKWRLPGMGQGCGEGGPDSHKKLI